MTPGLYRHVPMAEYLALDAVSASLLHAMKPTPMHGRHYMTQPREDTSALIVGEAAHYAALEPDKFGDRYVLPPKVDKRTTAGKAEWASWVADHPNQVALTYDEYWTAVGISKALLAHGEAARYLYGEGFNESTLVWDDDGTACKARPDRIALVDDWTWIVDIKTCRSAGAWGFSKAINDFGYHKKAAWYVDGLNRYAEMERRFLFVAVENTKPHAIALYELTDDAIGQGRGANAAALATYRECKATGLWPGYPTAIQYIDLPKYAQVEAV